MLGFWGVQDQDGEWVEVFVAEWRAREVFFRIPSGRLLRDLSEEGPLTYNEEAVK